MCFLAHLWHSVAVVQQWYGFRIIAWIKDMWWFWSNPVSAPQHVKLSSKGWFTQKSVSKFPCDERHPGSCLLFAGTRSNTLLESKWRGSSRYERVREMEWGLSMDSYWCDPQYHMWSPELHPCGVNGTIFRLNPGAARVWMCVGRPLELIVFQSAQSSMRFVLLLH